MSKWRQIVREEILTLLGSDQETDFLRQELLDHSLDRLQREFPDAKTPDQTLSRVLQDLRDNGEIEFLSPGTYRLLTPGFEGAAEREEEWAKPEPRPADLRTTTQQVTARPFQDWFRSWVLPNFEHRCAVCGLTPEWFLDAAHLRPVKELGELASDPSTGVALCKNHHQALDNGALVILEDLTLDLDRALLRPSSDETERLLLAFADGKLRTPARFDLHPEALPSQGMMR